MATPARRPKPTPEHDHRGHTGRDLPAPDTRLPHGEANDKEYDELESLRRHLSTQR